MAVATSVVCTLLLIFVARVDSQDLEMKTRCDRKTMTIEVPLPATAGAIAYLQHLRDYPDPRCHAENKNGVAVFNLPLKDIFRCGVTRIVEHPSGAKTYMAVVEVSDAPGTGKPRIAVAKCAFSPQPLNRTRRNVLPAGFQEEEATRIETLERRVRPPQLGVQVRQGGQLVTGELNVNPGTPLQMEVFMDAESTPIYGLLVSHMVVSDTRQQEETIIFNGCSVDPYLFDNFNTVDGDFLTAKFRAFKFPESAFVQFRGTVSVCLDKCRGVDCSNGVTGYGRRRRAVAEMPPDPNKVFEVTMTTFLKVDYEDDEAANMEKALLAARSDSPVAVEASAGAGTGSRGDDDEGHDGHVVDAGTAGNALGGGRALGAAAPASSGLEVPREEVPSFTVQESGASTISRTTPVLLLCALFTVVRSLIC